MKNKRKITTIFILCALAISSVFGALLSGCHEHIYLERVIEPTCTAQGYTQYVCSCGLNYVDQSSYVEKLEHVPVEVPAIAPTCMTDGRLAGVRCENCYLVLSGMEIDPSNIEHEIPDGARNCIHCNQSATGGFYYTYDRKTEQVAMTPIKNSALVSGNAILSNAVRFSAISSQLFFPVTQIKIEAFSKGCGEVKSFFIRENMRHIEEGCFQYCRSLEKIAVADGNEYFTNSQSVLYSKDMQRLICFPQQHYLTAFEDATKRVFEVPDGVTAIGDYAFFGAKNLTKITIPSSVTRIGKNAFKDCLGLQFNEYENGYYLGNEQNPYLVLIKTAERRVKNFTIHPDCKIIYDSAFKDAVSLEQIVVPNGVVDIGAFAFNGCSSLVDVSLPNTLENISEGAFKNCIYLETIDIPNSVTAFGKQAFMGCTELNTINLSSALKEISAECFRNCKKLVNITIPSSVNKIGIYAFYSCLDLEELVIPNGVKIIESYAFRNCTSLQRLTIPDSLEDVGRDLFTSCHDLVYNEYEQGYYLGNEQNKYVVMISVKDPEITNCTINENCKIIYAEAFKTCTKIEEISIPHNVISIGEAAFKYCKALRNITISDAVKLIGVDMFTECYALESITVDANNPIFSSYDGALYNKAKTIIICAPKNITTLEIAPTVIAIEDNAFNGCRNLVNLTLPTSTFEIIAKSRLKLKSVTINGGDTISQGVFESCSNLENLTLSDAITKIEKNALSNCSSLIFNEYQNGLYLGSLENPYLALISVKDNTATAFTLHEDCKIIYQRALSNMNSLEIVNFSSNLLGVGEKAFYGSDRIKTVNYDGDIAKWVEIEFIDLYSNPVSVSRSLKINGEDVTEIDLTSSIKVGAYALYNCQSITKVTLGNMVQSIGDYAFFGCSNLEEIFISDSVESIGNFAFSDCVKLKSVIIPDGVLTLGEKAFKGCTSLESAVLGHGITLIENRVFSGCTNIKEITIENNRATIGDCAFYYCRELGKITFNGSTVGWKAMKKGANWDYTTGEYQIICLDGDLEKAD